MSPADTALGEDAADAAGALDLMLADAALGTWRRFVPGMAAMPVFELIQYTPTTPTVHRVPLLLTPPVINKYYVVDLAPGRSMVEYLLSRGQQVFTISWRNPDARHRDWDFETYAAAILQAMDATRSITRSKTVHLQSFCSGGILSALLAGHLAATGRLGELASFNLGAAVLDQRRTGLPSALLDEGTAKAAVLASATRGYLDGRALAERGGGRKRAPTSLGRPAGGFAPIDAAPGTYVFDA